jgi:hypothetical protein
MCHALDLGFGQPANISLTRDVSELHRKLQEISDMQD